jgi:hypothetical protein
LFKNVEFETKSLRKINKQAKILTHLFAINLNRPLFHVPATADRRLDRQLIKNIREATFLGD